MIDAVNNYLEQFRTTPSWWGPSIQIAPVMIGGMEWDLSIMLQAPRMRLADGMTLSVQASGFHYARPRGPRGPYTYVEVGYPSAAIPELLDYAEDTEHLTGTVYGYVPVDLLNDIIAQHGGISGPTLETFDLLERVEESDG